MNCVVVDLLIFGYILDVVKLMFVTLNFRVRNNGVTRVAKSVYSSRRDGNVSTLANERIAADTSKNKRPTNPSPQMMM
jgi:hypothetical protein